jgi:hypothetical protein
LRESLEHGMYDNGCMILKKLADVNEDDEGDSSVDDLFTDQYDSDTAAEKLIKDDIIEKLITHMNAVKSLKTSSSSTTTSISLSTHSNKEDYDSFHLSETIGQYRKLKKSISKII